MPAAEKCTEEKMKRTASNGPVPSLPSSTVSSVVCSHQTLIRWWIRIFVGLTMCSAVLSRHTGDSGHLQYGHSADVAVMSRPGSINSVIMDQEGIKETLGPYGDASSSHSLSDQQRLTHIDVNESDTHVIAQSGHSAFLKCTVRNLGDQLVSWARRRDWHVLTSGRHVYTADERFQILRRPTDNQTAAQTGSSSSNGLVNGNKNLNNKSEWILQIQFVQPRDGGFYICQVPTDKGLASHQIQLDVLVPEVFILGQKDLIVDRGTTLSLVCIVENSPIPPEFVFWYHNDRLLNFDPSRAGVSVETEHGSRTHSQLKIANALETDTGNYTCRASNGQPASIYVQVWAGDQAAAMSRKNRAEGILVSASGFTWIYLLLLLFHVCLTINVTRR